MKIIAQSRVLMDAMVHPKTWKGYLIRSQESMIKANYVLKNIFDEIQLLMPGSEELNSTSKLSAAGEGKAILMGSFTLNMHLEKGNMAIGDLSETQKLISKGITHLRRKPICMIRCSCIISILPM